MNFDDFQITNDSISGNGEDYIGNFYIKGIVNGDHIKFTKSYTTGHHTEWIYWGIAKDNKIEGKWGEDITSPEGVF